jgi:outer membrane protein assembly factor BamD
MFRQSACTCALAALMLSALPQPASAQRESKPSQPAAQPDKALYDRGVADIRKNRFEVGRMTLQTLMNTYRSSEYLPKAQLAVAESWLKQGGERGRAQAREECAQLMRKYPDSAEARQAAGILRKAQEPEDKKRDPAR